MTLALGCRGLEWRAIEEPQRDGRPMVDEAADRCTPPRFAGTAISISLQGFVGERARPSARVADLEADYESAALTAELPALEREMRSRPASSYDLPER